MARILLADDDPDLRDALAMTFEDAGHEVVAVGDGLAAWKRLGEADLLVADVNMPGLDGFALVRRIREGGSELPVLLLTSRDGDIDEALGLDLGADDYVTKPFSSRVLLARIAALLRRQAVQSGAAAVQPAVEVGALRLDPERLSVTWTGIAIAVTVSEFRLLEALAGRPGVVFSRERLLVLVRDDDSVVVERIIDSWVRRLRRKFEAVDGDFACIGTVVGAGYRWIH